MRHEHKAIRIQRNWLRQGIRLFSVLTLTLPFTVTSVIGQNSDSIAKALLRLRSLNGNVSIINGRLYGGSIEAQITHSGQVNDVTDTDLLALFVSDPNRRLESVECGTREIPQTRTDFDACVERNAARLVQILFPSSLSSNLSGIDAAHNHSQLFLLTTALGMAGSRKESSSRYQIGGLAEHEWFSGDQVSGHAWQGLYQLNSVPMSFHGRYAWREDLANTRTATITADFHPSLTVDPSLDWRVGFDARSGIVYARSSRVGSGFGPLPLGSLDFGGGIWTSARKDFSRVRIGGATLFQASKSYVPSVGDNDFAVLTDAMNQRPLAYDIAYGTVVGFLTSERTSLNGRFMETRPVTSSANWPRPATRLGMISFSYLFGGITPVDVGYKISTAGELRAHSLFIQGNFRW